MIKQKIEKKVNEKKAKMVKELKDLIEKNRIIMIASIKNLPNKQFQLIKKELKNIASIKVIKKNLIKKAFENTPIKDLEKFIKENVVLIFSQLDPFELSLLLSEKKSPIRAKAGQIAENDIYIEAGPTELVPGPIISELGNAKIKFIIENGKITIKERSLVVKKGEIIDENKADLLAKFDIKPFYVSLIPIAAYDKESKKIYENISINKEEILKNLKNIFNKSLMFAVKIEYYCKETINYLLAMAKTNYIALEKFIKSNQNIKEEINQSLTNNNQN